MDDGDLCRTRRDPDLALMIELAAAGFDDAEEVGRGGFGTVYRAVQPELDRLVAVKVLTAELDAENQARFLREQRAMGRMTGHPNIVSVLAVGQTRTGRPYLVMPYHERGNLETRIRENGPLPVQQALSLGATLADALAAVHRLGIVHRDIKPANVLFTSFGEPALADFGIAHISGGFRTAAGTVTGSPAFTAPEVLTGDPPTPASDVHGLGATLFCALTGHAAFERHSGEQVVAQFLRITTQPAPDLRENGIPDVVSAVIERAMDRDPTRRPSATELAAQLRAVVGGDPAAPDPPGPLAAPAELPVELTSFVGRQTELTEIHDALATDRLVTLTGIGGVGKTRLALRAGSSSREAFPDGIWLVELGEVRDPATVVDTVASALGIRDYAGRTLLEVLVEVMSERNGLLVLDNCEQVVDAVADLVAILLSRCPDLRILATSREPLGLGETVIRVAPLTTPADGRATSPRDAARSDAVALFAERAAAAVPGFALSEANSSTVAQICARLDGLPLAIELAAARMRALSPEQILDRLTDRYRLLSRGARGVPPRQQTLRWSIDWSYDLCSPEEQHLWRQLSLFAGSFELDDVEGVCAAGESQLLDVLSSLVDKSILLREETAGTVRFRMLDTVREYGQEKVADTDEYADLCRRHRDWYQRLACDAEADWIGPRQLDWSTRLRQELPNLRQALEFGLTEDDDSALVITTALSPFWLARGMLTEGRRWLDRALDRPAAQSGPMRACAIYAVCMLTAFQDDRAATRIRADQAVAIADRDGDPVTLACAAIADGTAAVCNGEFDRAVTALEDAVERFAALGDIRLQIAALLHLGWAHQLRGERAAALADHGRVVELTESRGECLYRTYALWSSGVDVWRDGDRGRATRFLEEALRLTRRTDDPVMTFTCLQALAWITAQQGDPWRAVVLMAAAETLSRAVGSSPVSVADLRSHQVKFEQSTHDQLGPERSAAAHREGASMRMGDAIAYALGEQPRKASREDDDAPKLTKRERQIADLVADGLTNKAIATRLVISQRTVEGHVEHILGKLGFNSRAQVAAWVVEHSAGS
ncbi:protein kinase domain-containing protein [Speluncibacter jeojiensis]|uniref:Protein kinase n=1 Tax=Speluncibacter jeojiensis TaxID=2710754 RepID=A0A9X4RDC2_9ACTN|nr:protein kinase [Corynebacteriales bacterium D3-21]